MKLYYSPGACSLSPHIVLNEGGLAYQLEKVDLKTKQTESGKNYLTVNPKGYVPALELENGETLTEGPAIIQYLADQKPGAKLIPPAGNFERYRIQEMLNFISTELHKNYSALFNPNAPEAQKEAARENIKRRYRFLSEVLGEKSYLFGDTFQVPDAYLFTVTNWAKLHNIDLTPWPNLQKYQARIAARPAVQRALKEEGLI